jgi:hypothetical protein
VKLLIRFLVVSALLIPAAHTLRADRFTLTGSMGQPRSGHTATLLQDGRVLVAGGVQNAGSTGVLKTAEIYDPATRQFTAAGSMITPRTNGAATLLADGRVLISGGFNFTAETFTNLTAAEIFDPATSQFSSTGSMSVARSGHSMTLLHDGRVLVAGGTSSSSRLTEVYDPHTSAFTALPPMVAARGAAVAFTLPNGNALVAGGNVPPAAGAELFNITTGQFEAAPPRTVTVDGQTHGRTLLSSGQVLFAGTIGTGGISALSEVFDPAAGIFEATGSMNAVRSNHATAALADGRAIVTGGSDSTGNATSAAELFNPSSLFRLAAAMNSPRAGHTATALRDGTVLVVGGSSGGASLSSAEIYIPDTTIIPGVVRRRAARH